MITRKRIPGKGLPSDAPAAEASPATRASSRTIALFDAIAPLSLVFPLNTAIVEEEADFLSSLCGPRASFLDFGCGLGQLASALARRGRRVVGYEPSAEMRIQAARCHPRNLPRLVGSLDPLVEARERFDVVFARSVFPHLLAEKERLLALGAMRMLAKATGCLVFDLRLAVALPEEAEHIKASRDLGSRRMELLAARRRVGTRRFVNEWRVVERDRRGHELGDTRYSIPIRADEEDYAETLCRRCGVKILQTLGGYRKSSPLASSTNVIIASPRGVGPRP